MTYRGNDLDLRTAPPAERATAAGPARGGPIGVDELVLACCNGAFDVARFHASPEVRLEHLLHALTRIPAASDVLSALGIRVEQLRRDTAVAIAAAMPAGRLDDLGTPLTSAALHDVLRRAADLGWARRSPATVHDLLRTVLRGGPESPAAGLLLQAAADPHALERWRDEPALRALATPAGGADVASRDVPPALADTVHARLDQLEAALQAHGAEIAADRRTILEALNGLQGELQALRAAREQRPSRAQREPIDPALAGKIADIGQGMAALGERFAAFERLDGVEGRFADQMKEAAQAAAETSSKSVAAALVDAQSGVHERLDQTETTLQHLRAELERLSTSSGERQIALEASIRGRLEGADDAGKAHERDLAEIYEALVKLGTNQQTLGDNLNTWRLDSSGDVGILSNRLQQLEQTTRDLAGWLSDEMLALRREGGEDEPRRGNGFKRWLYGTSHVLSGGRRDVDAARQPVVRPRSDDTP